ncbi:MAG: protein BatD [Myxococcales bacterium]|nr:protein BatD [Myxococcales bacterium]
MPRARAAPFTLALALLVTVGSARADEPQITSTLSASEITLDETVQLTVHLTRDASQPYQGYQRPDLKDFDILHQGQAESTQWTINNGRQSVRTVEQHVYLLRPRHRGNCVVPPAVARVAGREWKSRQLSVLVTAAARRPPGSTPQPAEQPLLDPDAMRGDEELFLDARADKPTVYIGEQLLVTWSLYTRADILRYRAVTEPKHEDFWSEDLFSPPGSLSWTRQTVKGQEFQAALLLKKALFPLRSGKLTVTPLEAEATTLQTAFWAGGSAVRASRPIAVEVLPLPAQGRPEGFESANVGRFEVAAMLDKTQVKAGDAVTLRLIVRGEGNLKNVKLRKIERLDGFKVYEPTVAEHVEKGDLVRGDRVWSYLLLPQKGGTLALPSIEMPYFDPHEKRYAIARSQPLTVEVLGDPAKIGSGPAEASKENVLGARLLPLRNTHHVATRIGERIIRGPLLWVVVGAPPSLLLLATVGGALRAALVRETARTRRRRARAAARRRMREAEVHLKGQRPSQFFGACARAIYEHLEYRCEVKCEALTVDELRRLLSGRGFDPETTLAIVSELEICDFARFAPSASGPGEMRAAIRRVRNLLAAIEKASLTDEDAS